MESIIDKSIKKIIKWLDDSTLSHESRICLINELNNLIREKRLYDKVVKEDRKNSLSNFLNLMFLHPTLENPSMEKKYDRKNKQLKKSDGWRQANKNQRKSICQY